MKTLKLSLLVLVVGSLVFFANCKKGSDGPTEKETKTEILTSNSPWTLSAITLPDVNATEEEDWNNFSVTFSATQMTTAGYPAGASEVWPTSAWTANDNVAEITRTKDGVKMTVQTLNETTLKVSFDLPDMEINERTAALGGPYVFTLTSGN